MAEEEKRLLGLREQAPPSYEVSASPGRPAPANDEKSKSPLPLPRGPFPLDLPVLAALRSKRVILASASPRRKQLLAQIGLHNLEVVPSTVPEDFPKTLSPFEYVLATATQKANSVYAKAISETSRGEPELLLAADTVVVSARGTILEKPRSEAQHIAMLKDLRDSGRHSVVTAVVAMAPLASARDPGYAQESEVVVTYVEFDREVTDEMILAYVKTREGADKAGGYGIQGMGALLVEKVDGDYPNVVGLPLRATLKLMEKVTDKANLDDVGEEMDEFVDVDD